MEHSKDYDRLLCPWPEGLKVGGSHCPVAPTVAQTRLR